MKFPGGLLVNNLGQVVVHAQTASDQLHLLMLQTARGELVSRQTLISDGDTLPDGQTIKKLGLASLNHSGDIAVAARLDNGQPAVYVDVHPGATARQAATTNSPLPGSDDSVLTNMFGDFELLHDGSLLLVAGFAQAGTPRALRGGQALIHLTSPGVSDQGRVLVRSGDSIPGSADTLGLIGMIDCDGRDPTFVHQGLAARPPLTNGQPTGDGRTLLLGGSFNSTSPKLLARGNAVEVTPVLARLVPEGSSTIGPRLNRYGQVACVIEKSGTDTLYLEGRALLTAGQLSPLGQPILGFSAPVVGPRDLVFGQLYTESGSELFVTNGQQSRTYLSTGIELQGKTIRTLAFGLVRDMVDDDGTLVCLVEFTNGSQSVLMGVPH